jgi:hypothetical protein
MNIHSKIEELRRRFRAGDSAAGALLRRMLRPQLLRIVRRALRAGPPGSPLAAQVLKLAASQPARFDGSAGQAPLSNWICDRLCDELLPAGSVPPGNASRETMRGDWTHFRSAQA